MQVIMSFQISAEIYMICCLTKIWGGEGGGGWMR